MAKKKALILRIDPEFHSSLQKWASDEFRSLNGQIEYLLRQALAKAGRLKNRPALAEDSRDDASR